MTFRFSEVVLIGNRMDITAGDLEDLIALINNHVIEPFLNV
jgi:hypothetical protein